MPIDEAIGRRLAELRHRSALSQGDLAVAVNVSQGLICRYEQGRVRIPAERLITMAAALHVPKAAFFQAPGSPLPRVRFRSTSPPPPGWFVTGLARESDDYE